MKRVTDIMPAVALAGQEQSAAIARVNHANAQMDLVTQQDAAHVEEAAAAAVQCRRRPRSFWQWSALSSSPRVGRASAAYGRRGYPRASSLVAGDGKLRRFGRALLDVQRLNPFTGAASISRRVSRPSRSSSPM